MYTLLYLKWITNKDLSDSTGNSDQCYVGNLDGRGVWGRISLVQSLSPVWLCDCMDFSMPGFPVHHKLLELAQTHVCRVGDAIQPSHPLLSPSPLAFSLSQHQGLFQWVSFSHQVAKVLELQLQHQSFQWIFITGWIFIGGEWMHVNAWMSCFVVYLKLSQHC